ncbi:MAG: 3-isopropylmalate dehydratase large subunit [Actinobacteria bacterium]|nr:3-isopropylmalate dehydratase large subunit [Actinomycetota bacterium]MCL6105130.1 3-isopropylmalate dehydratase large subunit [Actinomycetota bacterium]
MKKTLLDKIWDTHLLSDDLIYIDLHLTHEVTSPQAFEALKVTGRKVRRPDLTIATADHDVPTCNTDQPVADPIAARQLEVLTANCAYFGITYYPMGSKNQGIVHVIGPELGLSQPGMTIVCGDSHTATHGAFGALAFGIGTSEVEHVLATQTLVQKKPLSMAITINGTPPANTSAKDIIIAIIAKIGTAGGAGHVIEYRGDTVQNLSMEARMTICNMSIEAGARAGMIAPDETTFAYIEGRKFAQSASRFRQAVDYWKSLPSDNDATFDTETEIDVSNLKPYVTWGTNPSQAVTIDGSVPDPGNFTSKKDQESAIKALDYMGLKPGTPIKDIPVDVVFIGSCTNARIEDLRSAATVVNGHKVAKNVTALLVPGSARVKQQAEDEGLDKIFIAAGFEWREPGCSMCLAMNPDKLLPQQRSCSTSNRNFEGRQGPGGRTHLASPAIAAATAILGHFGQPEDLGVEIIREAGGNQT